MRLYFARKERIEFGVLFGRNEVACKRSLSQVYMLSSFCSFFSSPQYDVASQARKLSRMLANFPRTNRFSPLASSERFSRNQTDDWLEGSGKFD